MPACKVYVHPKGFKVPASLSYRVMSTAYKIPNIYPVACYGYRLGQALHKLRLKGARQVEALGFKTDPILLPARFDEIIEGNEMVSSYIWI